MEAGSGQVDAVIGGYRNFELNQMDIEGVPGRCFYLEEEGLPGPETGAMLDEQTGISIEGVVAQGSLRAGVLGGAAAAARGKALS